MTNSKSTKRALLSSAFAIMLCAAMLIGTTFAWFTDTASTGVNKIVSGKLKVGLEYAKAWDNEGKVTEWDNAEGKTLNFKKAEGHEAEEILWEPGCHYELPELRVVNNGNLALKYKIQITGIQGDAKLNEVIDWTIDGAELGEEYHLTPTDKYSNPITIVGEMRTDANNDYQDLSIDGIGITVYATQDTVEYDSTGNQYDADAEYPTDADALANAMSNGGNIILGKDIDIKPEVKDEDKTVSKLVPQMIIKNDTSLNLAGKKIGVNTESADFGATSPTLMAVMDGTLTIDGNGEINCEAGENQVYGININGGNVIINDGKFYGAITAVQVQRGSLEINGGFFDMAPTCKSQVPQYAKYIVNCIDANYKDGTATISIKGGTFVNFDPSANPEGANTSYVAAGYTVKSEAHGSDTWYTVVPVTASSTEELADLIKANNEGTVKLDSGTYKIPSELQDKSLTITGTKDTVIDMKNVTSYHATAVNFEGVTVEFGGDPYAGFQHTSSITFKDCEISGMLNTYGDAVFENCTFKSAKEQYALHIYGGNNFMLTNCHFYGVDKNVYIYQEGVDCDKNVTFNNCDFHMTAASGTKSAVMLNSANNFGSYKYNLVMNGCTEEGANATAAANEAGKTNYQGLYGLKHINGSDKPQLVIGTVTIDGKVVYSN